MERNKIFKDGGLENAIKMSVTPHHLYNQSKLNREIYAESLVDLLLLKEENLEINK